MGNCAFAPRVRRAMPLTSGTQCVVSESVYGIVWMSIMEDSRMRLGMFGSACKLNIWCVQRVCRRVRISALPPWVGKSTRRLLSKWTRIKLIVCHHDGSTKSNCVCVFECESSVLCIIGSVLVSILGICLSIWLSKWCVEHIAKRYPINSLPHFITWTEYNIHVNINHLELTAESIKAKHATSTAHCMCMCMTP